jgi:hypothetical protein
MLLAAKYIPSLLQFKLTPRTSLGNRESDPPFSRFFGGDFPIPDWPGIGNLETGRRAGDFLV